MIGSLFSIFMAVLAITNHEITYGAPFSTKNNLVIRSDDNSTNVEFQVIFIYFFTVSATLISLV